MSETHEVRLGQIWEDCDTRGPGAGTGRRVRVIEVGGVSARVENVKTKRRTYIRLRRFRPSSTGYRLVEDLPDA